MLLLRCTIKAVSGYPERVIINEGNKAHQDS